MDRSKTKNESIQAVLDGLQNLILMGANATAYREHSPSADADADGDLIAYGHRQVAFLREMRTRFEDVLFLGNFPEVEAKAAVKQWLDTPQEGLDNHTPRQMGIKPPRI